MSAIFLREKIIKPNRPSMDNISFEDFQKIELKVGKIVAVAKVEKSDKLLKLEVDFGEEKRQVISGIAKEYSPEDLVNKEFTFITNLEPRSIMGLESQAMVLAVDVAGEAVLLRPEREVPEGAKIR